jgi:ribose transport system ATP-binding protein
VKDISFELHRSEILGFGGLADSGIHEIGRLVFGLAATEQGTVSVGKSTFVINPRQAMAARIGYMSKNRDQESLMVRSSIRDNICLPSYKKLLRGGLVNPGAEKKFVDSLSGKLSIKMRDSGQFVLELSGGNKQKAVIAKWLGFGADILVLDCPTRGIDIGVKANIYDLIGQLKAQGKSMILISEELPELIGMSDRILIIKDGVINGEFSRMEGLTEFEMIDHMV